MGSYCGVDISPNNDRLTQLCKHQLFQLLQTAYQKGMPIKEAIIATKEAVH